MFHLPCAFIDLTKTEYWSLTIIVVAGLARVFLIMLGEIIDYARVVYFKLRDFKKSQDSPVGKPSP